MDGSEITSFNIAAKPIGASLKSPDENYYALTPQNCSPANVFRSDDCNELLAKELADLDYADADKEDDRRNLVSQSSIEIEICAEDEKKIDDGSKVDGGCDIKEPAFAGEVGFITFHFIRI